MKFLKLKSILFSLTAIAVIAVFFSSCQKETTEKLAPVIVENNIDSELPLTSNPEDSNNSFKDMVFENTEIPVLKNENSDIEGKVILLNGKLIVSSIGEISGDISAISTDKTVNGNVFFKQGTMIYQVEDKTVELNLQSGIDELLLSVGGNKKVQACNLYEIIDELVENKAQKTNELEIEQQAVYAFLAITSSEAWNTNLKYAMTSTDLNLRACNAWEWATAASASAAIGILGGAGCAVLGASCAAGSLPFIAGTAYPCYVVTAACGALVAGGANEVRKVFQNYLCNGCTEPRNVRHYKLSNNKYRIVWDGTIGEDHSLYYSFDRRTNTRFYGTTSTLYELNLFPDVRKVYIGVRAECGGDPTKINYTEICNNC